MYKMLIEKVIWCCRSALLSGVSSHFMIASLPTFLEASNNSMSTSSRLTNNPAGTTTADHFQRHKRRRTALT